MRAEPLESALFRSADMALTVSRTAGAGSSAPGANAMELCGEWSRVLDGAGAMLATRAGLLGAGTAAGVVPDRKLIGSDGAAPGSDTSFKGFFAAATLDGAGACCGGAVTAFFATADFIGATSDDALSEGSSEKDMASCCGGA